MKRRTLLKSAIRNPHSAIEYTCHPRWLCCSIHGMRNLNFFRTRALRVLAGAVLMAASLAFFSQAAMAVGWNGIEPLKSRRADVERALGKPVEDRPGDGTLHFKVQGGTVTVLFVSARFAATKKLSPDLEGTVLQILLQHDKSSETPESMGLVANSNFQREETQGVIIFRNQKDGIFYTFFDGKLKTTRYTASATQLGRARKG